MVPPLRDASQQQEQQQKAPGPSEEQAKTREFEQQQPAQTTLTLPTEKKQKDEHPEWKMTTEHTTVHTEPRPTPYDSQRYVITKRLFHTPPEVLGMAIVSGRMVHERILTTPWKTVVMSIEAGCLLSFGVLMSCQVGGRWGSNVGVNNFVFGGFGIPFGLTFITILQGSELMTANYMYTTCAVLACSNKERPRQIKGLLANWFFCWWGNFFGCVLHFTLFAWQSGLIKTIKIKGNNGLPAKSYSDTQNTLEHADVLYYESQDAFRDDFYNTTDAGLCQRDKFLYANLCRVLDLSLKKTTANFATTVLRGWGCNWMVCLAMWLQTTATEPISKLFMIWIPIVLFVSIGFDHFVVNQWLLPGGILLGGYYLDHRINWGNAFWFNLFPATIGAVLGAWSIALPFYFLNAAYYKNMQSQKKDYRPMAICPASPTGIEYPPPPPSGDHAC